MLAFTQLAASSQVVQPQEVALNCSLVVHNSPHFYVYLSEQEVLEGKKYTTTRINKSLAMILESFTLQSPSATKEVAKKSFSILLIKQVVIYFLSDWLLSFVVASLLRSKVVQDPIAPLQVVCFYRSQKKQCGLELVQGYNFHTKGRPLMSSIYPKESKLQQASSNNNYHLESPFAYSLFFISDTPSFYNQDSVLDHPLILGTLSKVWEGIPFIVRTFNHLSNCIYSYKEIKDIYSKISNKEAEEMFFDDNDDEDKESDLYMTLGLGNFHGDDLSTEDIKINITKMVKEARKRAENYIKLDNFHKYVSITTPEDRADVDLENMEDVD